MAKLIDAVDYEGEIYLNKTDLIQWLYDWADKIADDPKYATARKQTESIARQIATMPKAGDW